MSNEPTCDRGARVWTTEEWIPHLLQKIKALETAPTYEPAINDILKRLAALEAAKPAEQECEKLYGENTDENDVPIGGRKELAGKHRVLPNAIFLRLCQEAGIDPDTGKDVAKPEEVLAAVHGGRVSPENPVVIITKVELDELRKQAACAEELKETLSRLRSAINDFQDGRPIEGNEHWEVVLRRQATRIGEYERQRRMADHRQAAAERELAGERVRIEADRVAHRHTITALDEQRRRTEAAGRERDFLKTQLDAANELLHATEKTADANQAAATTLEKLESGESVDFDGHAFSLFLTRLQREKDELKRRLENAIVAVGKGDKLLQSIWDAVGIQSGSLVERIAELRRDAERWKEADELATWQPVTGLWYLSSPLWKNGPGDFPTDIDAAVAAREAQEKPEPPTCPTCGSTRRLRHPTNGEWVCDIGHRWPKEPTL